MARRKITIYNKTLPACNRLRAETFDSAWEALCDSTGTTFSSNEGQSAIKTAMPFASVHHVWQSIIGYAIAVEHVIRIGGGKYRWQRIPSHLEEAAPAICNHFRGLD
jgi:hypothetical protein